MKSVSDYIVSISEDAVPVNVVSSGSIATKDTVVGSTQKRKPDPIPEAADVTTADDDELKKRMFKQKQQITNDSMSS